MPQRQLVLFPFAGGSSQSFAAVRQWLPDFDTIAVDYPGHHIRHAERLLESVTALAVDCLGLHQHVLRDGYIAVGASLGALVAYEFTRLTMQAGVAPSALIAISAAAPGRHAGRSNIHTLSDADFARALADRYPGEPSAVIAEPDTFSVVLPPLRADVAAFENYRPATNTAAGTPVLALGGTRDRAVAFADLLAWSGQGEQAEVVRIDGGHFLTLEAPSRVAGEALVWLDKIGLYTVTEPQFDASGTSIGGTRS